jgi:hypothetical protein
MRLSHSDLSRVAVTFDQTIQATPFVKLMSELLSLLEENYHTPVDIEFTLAIPDPSARAPAVEVSLLQCRPQSRLQEVETLPKPEAIPTGDIIFSTISCTYGFCRISVMSFCCTQKPICPTASDRIEVGRLISRLNSQLPENSFICVGPGRWGTENIDLGVYVGYPDICNAAALVELSGGKFGIAPDPSLGTHFFQDLMEAQIYPVAVLVDHKGTAFNGISYKSRIRSATGAADNWKIACGWST